MNNSYRPNTTQRLRPPVGLERLHINHNRGLKAIGVIASISAIAGAFALGKMTEIEADCSGPTRTYTVEPGDTLYGLLGTIEGADKLNNDDVINDIKELNPSIEGSTIILGSTIELPVSCRVAND